MFFQRKQPRPPEYFTASEMAKAIRTDAADVVRLMGVMMGPVQLHPEGYASAEVYGFLASLA